MKKLFGPSFLALAITTLPSCSLDDRYFDARKTSAYSLGYSVIPQASVEEVSLSSNGETIAGVFVKAINQGADTKTILYVHGDDKDIDKYWARVEHLYPLDVNIFIFDFQGYGKSTGKPSLKGITQNTRDALSYLKTRGDVNQSKIIHYAFSLGAIFSLDVSANTEMPQAVIAENSPSSSDGVIRSSTGVGIPGSFFFDETFDNVENISRLTVPVLLFHSKNDETIPFDGNARPLFAAARQPKTTVEVEIAQHSDLIEVMTPTAYRAAITSFFNANGL